MTTQIDLGREISRRLTEVLAFSTVVVAIVGMFLSSPRFSGPDENAHQATAWYVASNGLPPRSESVSEVPAIIPTQVCFAFSPEADTGCIGPRDSQGTNTVRIFNYPPVYYWAVALGQQGASVVSGIWIDIGGRLGSIAVNVAVLTLVALLAARRTESWGTYLLLVSTPMAVFLWAVVNPSGWEISTGLLFAYLFAQAWWGQLDKDRHQRTGRLHVIYLIVASIVFALSRHDAIVWLSLLVVSIMFMGPGPATIRSRVAVLTAPLAGLAAGLLWQLGFPAQHPAANPFPVERPGFSDYVGWLAQIDNAMADRVRQMVGVLGWLDTPIPQWLMFLLLASWAMLIGILYARSSMKVTVLAIGFLGAAVFPAAIELVRWNDWPYWYQGRITLPFAIPFLFLVLVRFGDRARRPAIAVSLLSALALAFMIWQNLIRNSFGVRGYLPQRWTGPVLDNPMYWGSLICIVLLIALTGVRLALMRRECLIGGL